MTGSYTKKKLADRLAVVCRRRIPSSELLPPLTKVSLCTPREGWQSKSHPSFPKPIRGADDIQHPAKMWNIFMIQIFFFFTDSMQFIRHTQLESPPQNEQPERRPLVFCLEACYAEGVWPYIVASPLGFMSLLCTHETKLIANRGTEWSCPFLARDANFGTRQFAKAYVVFQAKLSKQTHTAGARVCPAFCIVD